jgi:hypothetical protein
MTRLSQLKAAPFLWLPIIMALTAACSGSGDGPIDETGRWVVVDAGLPAALISIWGTDTDDIWAVGADPKDGTGPLVFRYDGAAWSRIQTGRTGDLWWVFGFRDGPVFLGGQNGMILRREGDRLDLMETPGRGTVFGIWGTAPDDLWAVGGNVSDGAFAWRYDGERWSDAPNFPTELAEAHSMFKVWGPSADDVWVIGTGGVALRFQNGLVTRTATETARSLFTVHGNSDLTVTVGGSGANGRLLEYDGEEWSDVTPEGTPHIIGVRMAEDVGYAVGVRGSVARWDGRSWSRVETGITLSEAFHTVWLDPDGGVWAVGGRVVEPPLVDGVMVYRRPK